MRLLFIIVILSALSCSSIDSDEIVGNWIIYSVKDRGNYNIPNQEVYQNNLNEHFVNNRLVILRDGSFEEPDDKYDDLHSYGRWFTEESSLTLRYDDGGEITYKIHQVSDSTLIIIDEDYAFRLYKLPFERPSNDTLKTGTYYFEKEEDDLPLIEFIDFDTDSILTTVTDTRTYSIWLTSTLTNYDLEHYNLTFNNFKNCQLKGTAKRNLYELIVSKEQDSDSASITYSLEYSTDSILVNSRSWTDSSKNEFSEELTTFPKTQTIYFEIKDSRQ